MKLDLTFIWYLRYCTYDCVMFLELINLLTRTADHNEGQRISLGSVAVGLNCCLKSNGSGVNDTKEGTLCKMSNLAGVNCVIEKHLEL